MKKVLFVDDLRTLTVAKETEYGLVTYVRTAQAANAVDWREYDIIFLDHDLGMADGKETDVRDFVSRIEEYSFEHNMDIYKFVIITSNAVGRKWILDALRQCQNVSIEYN